MSAWSTLRMMTHMALDGLSRQSLPRVPEGELVMAGTVQVDAYAASGDAAGPLAPIQLFLAVHAGVAMPAEGVVLDMACGPCTQLIRVARLHPHVHFIGMDASAGMLAQAALAIRAAGVDNITLQSGDMCTLAFLADASVDAVMCTMSLHHLADTEALQATLRAAARVLKPGGGVYLADFGRLRRMATIDFLVHDREAEQSPQFTADFLSSMRAAFSVAELRAAVSALGASVALHQTALAPFILLFQRALQAQPDAVTIREAQAQFRALAAHHQSDFKALSNWFSASGLPLPYAIDAAGA